jgi:hypothetical protein
VRESVCGAWSHGIAHEKCYGGSHEFLLVLLPDGRGSYRHSGWWVYRYFLLRWELSDSGVLSLQCEQSRVYTDMGYGSECVRVARTPVSVEFDTAQGRERLTVPLLNREPSDFYLLTRTDAEQCLGLEFLNTSEFG